MKVKELRLALEETQAALSASGAVTQSQDILELLTLFDGCDDDLVDPFLDDLNQRLDPIKVYKVALRDAGTNPALFDKVMCQLQSDKGLAKEQVYSIAHGYIGGRSKWPSKPKAFDAIRENFLQLSYQKVKLIGVESAALGKVKATI